MIAAAKRQWGSRRACEVSPDITDIIPRQIHPDRLHRKSIAGRQRGHPCLSLWNPRAGDPPQGSTGQEIPPSKRCVVTTRIRRIGIDGTTKRNPTKENLTIWKTESRIGKTSHLRNSREMSSTFKGGFSAHHSAEIARLCTDCRGSWYRVYSVSGK